MLNVCTMLNFDGGESVEHARAEGNNPTLGCEVVAGGLTNCVDFWRVMRASSFVQKVIVEAYAFSFMQLPMPRILRNHNSTNPYT